MTILNLDWDSLLESTDLLSVKPYAQEINTGFLIFFKTDEEFIINDRGYVSERYLFETSDISKESLIEYSRDILGIDDSDVIDEILKNSEHFIDTAIWIPISPNLAIVNASLLFVNFLQCPQEFPEYFIRTLESRIFGHLNIPTNSHKNEERIEKEYRELLDIHDNQIRNMPYNHSKYFKNFLRHEAIMKHRSEEDLFTYDIHKLGKHQTMDWNILTMNETDKQLCVKTPLIFIPTIEEYNKMKSEGIYWIKKDYHGFEDKIISLLENL